MGGMERLVRGRCPRRDGARSATEPSSPGLLFTAYLFLVVAPQAKTVGFDALSYYLYTIDDPYWITHGTMGSFVYSPIAARLFQATSLLPFWQFLWLWLGVLVATALWLGGRRWLWVLAFPPVALELYHGNIHLLIAAAIALGFRYPAAWAFVLADQGHARRRAAVVRRPAGVAQPRDRARRDRRPRRDLAGRRLPAVGHVDRPAAARLARASRRASRRSRSRCCSACPPPRCS